MGGNLKKKSVKILGRSPLKSILPIFGTIDKSIYLSPILVSEARRRVSKRRRGKRFFSRRFHGKTVFLGNFGPTVKNDVFFLHSRGIVNRGNNEMYSI